MKKKNNRLERSIVDVFEILRCFAGDSLRSVTSPVLFYQNLVEDDSGHSSIRYILVVIAFLALAFELFGWLLAILDAEENWSHVTLSILDTPILGAFAASFGFVIIMLGVGTMIGTVELALILFPLNVPPKDYIFGRGISMVMMYSVPILVLGVVMVIVMALYTVIRPLDDTFGRILTAASVGLVSIYYLFVYPLIVLIKHYQVSPIRAPLILAWIPLLFVLEHAI